MNNLTCALTLGVLLVARTAPACDLVDTATAEAVLGSEVTDTTFDPASFCNFISNTTSASFSIRTDSAEMYDTITIQQPHTEVDIGDRGRYNVGERGNTAVQFAKGSKSATLAVTTPGGNKDTDYLPALLEAAKAVAEKLE